MKKYVILGMIFGLLLIPSVSFEVLSDNDIMNKYTSPQALQNAIDSGEVNYNDLSKNIQKSVHEKNPYDKIQNQITNMTNISILIFALIVPIVLIIWVLGRLTLKDSEDSEDKEIVNGTSSDKTKQPSMDKVKTKEDHPMGDRTHD